MRGEGAFHISVFLGAGLELQCRSHWGSSGLSALGWYYPYGFRVERDALEFALIVCSFPDSFGTFRFSPECVCPGVSLSSLLAVSEV